MPEFVVKSSKELEFSSPEDVSILDSAMKNGYIFEYSCKTGLCGVCKTTLLEGEVIELQPQIALTESQKENKQILTCCCAPKTDILIDADDLSALHGIETKTLPARISTIKKHTSEIIEVTLRFPPTAQFKFLEGQFIDVIHNNIHRSYSIASIASQKEITLLIKRFEGGKMSSYWFDQAEANDLLRVEGPKGTFFLRDSSKPLLFLATGTGISPIMSILNSLEENDGFQQRQAITVYWGNRYPKEFIWQPAFKKLNVDFIQVCSKPDKGWDGKVGYVQDIAMQKQPGLLESTVYACGSNSMIQSAKKVFTNTGLPENQFYSDAFVQSY